MRNNTVPPHVKQTAAKILRDCGYGCEEVSTQLVEEPPVLDFLHQLVATRDLPWEERDHQVEPARQTCMAHLRQCRDRLGENYLRWSVNQLMPKLENQINMLLHGAVA